MRGAAGTRARLAVPRTTPASAHPLTRRPHRRPPKPSRFRAQTGLPLVPYFTASKLAWCLENVPGLRADAEAGRALAGTIDSFLIWRLTGGREHATDVTNASRTLLFNIHTLTWDDALLRAFGVPRAMLPRVVSSSTRVAQCAASSALAGVPIAGVLGDQQAALFGQVCFSPGDAKNTYGTGCFLLMNAGTVVPKPPVEAGLLVTVAYQIGSAPPVYALEGSVAVAGAAVSWLRDNLGLISSPAELETLAASVPHTSGAVFVPAFNGLFAPHWRTDARGVLVGLSGAVGRAQIARATLEAVAHQPRELLGAMEAGAGAAVKGADLKVDGGMTVNNTLMQFQADVTGRRCVRPVVAETTALGAAYAAGLAVGFWKDQNALQSQWKESAAWAPAMPAADVAKSVLNWDRALARALHWQVTEPKADATLALLRGGGRASTAAAAAAVNSAGAVRVVGKGRPALFAAACAGAVAGGVLVHAWREGGSSFI